MGAFGGHGGGQARREVGGVAGAARRLDPGRGAVPGGAARGVRVVGGLRENPGLKIPGGGARGEADRGAPGAGRGMRGVPTSGRRTIVESLDVDPLFPTPEASRPPDFPWGARGPNGSPAGRVSASEPVRRPARRLTASFAVLADGGPAGGGPIPSLRTREKSRRFPPSRAVDASGRRPGDRDGCTGLAVGVRRCSSFWEADTRPGDRVPG